MAVGVEMAVIGAVALALGRPLLIPSLGPTAFLQANAPYQPTARFYNVVVGHPTGFAVGCLFVILLGATQMPSVFETHVPSAPRMLAAVLALAVTMLLGILLRAQHPAAATTTLLVAFGGFNPMGMRSR